MQQHVNGINTEFKRDPHQEIAGLVAHPYDIEKVLSLDLIRQHTKTDDVPSVTNELLSLYRKAAIGAAKKYTGLLFDHRQVVTEDVKTPLGTSRRPAPHFFIHKMRHPAAESTLWYYGHKNMTSERVGVAMGAREVRLPRVHDDFGLGCCNPCGSTGVARIMYMAGFACEEDFPAEFVLGALKYIAHVLENAGDNVIATTVAGDTGSSNVNLSDANDPVVASGALNIWRTLIPQAY